MKKYDVTDIYAPAFLGLRMLRLTDRLVREGSEATTAFGIDAPVRTFSTLLTLRQEDCSVTEIADRLGMTHAGAIKNVRALEAEKLVLRKVDRQDSRRKPLSLTVKGRKEADRVERFTRIAQQAYQQIFAEIGVDVAENINRMQNALDEVAFDQRILSLYGD